MNSKVRAATGLIALVVVSLILVRYVNAVDTGLNLPSMPVTIEVYNGTESYYDTLLSNVPSGYNVENGSYLGWCVDRRCIMQRSPATHQVTLFSSCNPPNNLTGQKWDMVNYILNHKQGASEDIQQAIWYFINLVGNYLPSRPTALAMINDTNANGIGFVPTIDQTIAVICYTTESKTQITIIEARIPAPIPEYPLFLVLPLFMMTIVIVAVYQRKHVAMRSR
jgi:hypothetical protein